MRRALAVAVLVLLSTLSVGLDPASAAVPTPTTTTLTISPPSPAVVGQEVTFTVTVTSATGAVPVGSVGILKADTVFGTLACTANAPAPVNAGQPNTAGAKTGQCTSL